MKSVVLAQILGRMAAPPDDVAIRTLIWCQREGTSTDTQMYFAAECHYDRTTQNV